MASTDILSQTLSSITAIKLDQLHAQKDAYESKKRSLCENVVSEVNTAERVKKLLQGAEALRSVGLKKSAALSSMGEFLDQARYDPSVTEPLLKEYEAELRGHLDAQTNKYEFASLYGKLVEEWIALGNSDATSAAEGSGFVLVGREEMHQQRATWEEYVFKAKETDRNAIQRYLEGVFSSKEAKRGLEAIREKFKTFQKDWKSQRHFDQTALETVIKGMLRSDILTEEKRTTLRDFLGNRVVLSEIADVLNMRMSAIASWSWGAPLIVEQRRNLNGRYRFYTDEDLLHAIFIYYVGLQWACYLRKVLVEFVKTEGVWKSDSKPISKSDARRRRFFLNDAVTLHKASVQKDRDNHFGAILLNQLPISFHEVRDSYDGVGCKNGDTRPSHVRVVQGLLQRLQTEILMQTKLGKEITVIRSDFKWFGPSLPHSTIFAVLEFFGVQAGWLDFFKRVLEATMRFKHDSPDTPAQARKRGTPISTPIADFFAESILFCLDYAVNQKAGGTRLYRLHDDMWLWGGFETCSKAWKVITEFTDTMGLELNPDKTGSVRIARDRESAMATDPRVGLPKGDVKWGFLRLDPATGRFLINEEEVDKHIEELRLQLSACRSVLDYIQAWNIYGNRFFANNFGRPANCYGLAHIDSMLATFRRIQDKLFPDHAGGVGEHLKQMIASRFGVAPTDIPDGYLYWPTSLGGLGLQNPFITLLLSRRQVTKNPEKLIDKYLEEEEFAYARAKARFAEHSDSGSGSVGPGWVDEHEFEDLRDEPFMSLAEFTRYRERTESALGKLYRKLIGTPDTAVVVASGEVKAALAAGGGGDADAVWSELSDYDKWVVQLYHKDMVARFGGVEVVDKGLLPTGLMAMLWQSRFRWQG
ncbi:fcf70192-9d2e-461d-ac3e-b1c1c620ab04 [Thermothielavioides terrestris]|uniref:Reverse transcriptase domain-containing protein n=2 Tax=Thermothielavioides terrestris TaxID=2587410 RepID=G2QTD8_THETT|nr:uncharacterized protein THITE_2107302 [Thermothielavioides terrestris NRRL 8126]AEO62755.1 hypothetical protein THITE_2107302 [Thermothielavioides terrestris NRRL 8126]SPQ21751.1 fcf70192-9d2e-461d-ac3e-b1c1c620ab04 [Thermothielavioides terrestris]